MDGKIILNLAISIDGYIADEDGGYDWIRGDGKDALNTDAVWKHEEFLKSVAAVVMGKRCYDQGFHLEYRDRPVYVATSGEPDVRGNVRFIGGDVCGAVAGLKRNAGGDIYLFGGGKLADGFIKAGLVDEYVIGLIPVILGGGIPLFRGGNPTLPLELTHYYVENGIVVLRYVPRKDD